MIFHRADFYSHVRKSGLFGKFLEDSEVRGIEGILNAFRIYGDGRPKTLAYALATAYHETGGWMIPVREGFAKTDAIARRIVARRPYGKPHGKYGHVYYGRGHVQLTWLDNYARTGKLLHVDLVADPDKMLDPLISARVLVEGLIDGRWNGQKKGIAWYLPDNGPDDLENARRTVNILDKWALIAGYYRIFLVAIEAAQNKGE
jgi:hypothetical protein